MINKAFPKITKKILIGIIVADCLLCAIVFSASYWAFNKHFKVQYDSIIREISATARECLNPDDFSRYLATKQEDDKYKMVFDILDDFVEKFELNLIYVSVVEPPDYTHITYIYDPINKVKGWKPYPLGYEEDYHEPNYNASTKRVFEEGATIVRHTIKTRSGSHITAQLPVYDSSGKIVAVIGAQKNIQEFVNARRSFARFMMVSLLIFTVAFTIIFALYFNIRFIKPILIITTETDRFASYSRNPSKRLLSVTNRDELGTLAKSVYQMENEIAGNIAALKKMTEATALALAKAIDAKDSYTHGHSTRVAEYSLKIAQLAGKSESECRTIHLTALMHDIGKIGVPNDIINKQGKLTDEEYRVIKAHPVIGKQILANITQAPHISDGAFYHHERYDGKGYPTGLVGKNIPDVARIIAIADAYDAMTSNRSYRGTLSQNYVRTEIEKGIGTQFDPEYAKIMLKLIDEDKNYTMRESPNN